MLQDTVYVNYHSDSFKLLIFIYYNPRKKQDTIFRDMFNWNININISTKLPIKQELLPAGRRTRKVSMVQSLLTKPFKLWYQMYHQSQLDQMSDKLICISYFKQLINIFSPKGKLICSLHKLIAPEYAKMYKNCDSLLFSIIICGSTILLTESWDCW